MSYLDAQNVWNKPAKVVGTEVGAFTVWTFNDPQDLTTTHIGVAVAGVQPNPTLFARK